MGLPGGLVLVVVSFSFHFRFVEDVVTGKAGTAQAGDTRVIFNDAPARLYLCASSLPAPLTPPFHQRPRSAPMDPFMKCQRDRRRRFVQDAFASLADVPTSFHCSATQSKDTYRLHYGLEAGHRKKAVQCAIVKDSATEIAEAPGTGSSFHVDPLNRILPRLMAAKPSFDRSIDPSVSFRDVCPGF